MFYSSALVVAFLSASLASAQVDPLGPELDPLGAEYGSSAIIPFPTDIQLKDLDLVAESPVVTLPPPGSGPQSFPATSFFDVFVDISLDGGATFHPLTGGTGQTTETVDLPTSSSPTETFDTQMTALDINGSVNGHSLELMLNPSDTDTGQTTVTDMGGGHFQINSFFDVFTELSLDGGQFVPQQGGPTVLTLSSVPDAGATLPLLLVPVALLGVIQFRLSPRRG